MRSVPASWRQSSSSVSCCRDGRKVCTPADCADRPQTPNQKLRSARPGFPGGPRSRRRRDQGSLERWLQHRPGHAVASKGRTKPAASSRPRQDCPQQRGATADHQHRAAAAGQIARQDHHDHHGDQQPHRQRGNDLARQPVHVEVECRRASSPAAAPKSGAEHYQQRRQLGEVRLATWECEFDQAAGPAAPPMAGLHCLGCSPSA
jgi:hypothetical protein